MKLLVLITALLQVAVPAFAAPQCSDVLPGTLDKFLALGPDGCLVSDKTFSGFTYVPQVPRSGANAAGPNAANIAVIPLPDATNPGLEFNFSTPNSALS